MSVKKTSSPLSSGAESLDPLGGKEELRGGEKVSKSFEAALAEIAEEVEQPKQSEKSDGLARSAFQQIAANANLDSPEEAMSAVRESAQFLVESSLGEDVKRSKQGKKVSTDLSNYISKDPLLHQKILKILQKLK